MPSVSETEHVVGGKGVHAWYNGLNSEGTIFFLKFFVGIPGTSGD